MVVHLPYFDGHTESSPGSLFGAVRFTTGASLSGALAGSMSYPLSDSVGGQRRYEVAASRLGGSATSDSISGFASDPGYGDHRHLSHSALRPRASLNFELVQPAGIGSGDMPVVLAIGILIDLVYYVWPAPQPKTAREGSPERSRTLARDSTADRRPGPAGRVTALICLSGNPNAGASR